MVDTNEGTVASRLGGDFGVGVLLLVVAVVVLLGIGGRVLPGWVGPVPVLSVVLLLVLAALLVRRSSGTIPELENDLRDLVDDYRCDIEAYERELSVLDDDDALVASARVALEQMDRDLQTARRRLSNGQYISAYRHYVTASRGFVDVVPALVRADRERGRNANRLAELVDDVRYVGAQLPNEDARHVVQWHLSAYDPDVSHVAPEDVDVSPLRSAMRRIDTEDLFFLTYLVQLRGFLGWLNTALSLVVVTVSLVALSVAHAEAIAFVTTFTVPTGTARSLLLIPVVFVFGGLGAVLNVFRRFGWTDLFGDTTRSEAFPNQVVMRPALYSRVLWGSVAAFVVYVFTSLSGGFNPESVVLTAIVAGFSEQLLENVLVHHRERQFGTTGVADIGVEDGPADEESRVRDDGEPNSENAPDDRGSAS
ncbi:hypothetical protein [Salinigranum sp. GCM10025319]|uniref:hypothetical protein n=1 Tax=Salinigranum sp. GCM10025319 TaxID=3252687 RepID=UPI003609F964